MSQLEVDKIIPSSGTTINIGDSGDTVNISDGTALTVDTNTLAIDQANNRVGIGTTSPSQKLEVVGGNGDQFTLDNTGQSLTQAYWNNNGTSKGAIWAKTDEFTMYGYSGVHMRFYTNATERMRIDSSGNLLVGTTTATIQNTSGANDGLAYFAPEGILRVRSNATTTLQLNRTSNDGNVIELRKDGTTVGSIGNTGSILKINGNSSGIYVGGSGASIWAQSDNTHDLGTSGLRFDDIFATNGTIQTSDQNEKQSIQSLTSSEIAVAKRISKLFKTFKFNSSVEEKGDNARIHTGVIAQDVQQAFTDEGLDASNYSLFISSTWWEKEISVNAVAEELDEEGNVIVEGQDAYTYTDIKEEATEGYTEKNKIRY
jgi:ribosomal protein L9